MEIQVIGDTVPVRFRPGTQPGDNIRIKGKGVPYVDRPGTGDLVVTAKVELPQNPSSKEIELLKLLDRLTQEKN